MFDGSFFCEVEIYLKYQFNRKLEDPIKTDLLINQSFLNLLSNQSFLKTVIMFVVDEVLM